MKQWGNPEQFHEEDNWVRVWKESVDIGMDLMRQWSDEMIYFDRDMFSHIEHKDHWFD